MTGPATSASDCPLTGLAASRKTSRPTRSVHPVGRARDHHPAVAVPDHNDVAQVLELEHRRDVLNVAVQVHLGVQEVGPLAQARHGRRVDQVALGLQEAGHPLVAPAP